MFYLEIQIYIPAIVQEQLLEVKFQFATPRFRLFGERMVAKINIVQDAIHMADVLSSRESMAGIGNALRVSDPSALIHVGADVAAAGDKQDNFTEAEMF